MAMTLKPRDTEPPLPLAADFPPATEAQWRALVDKVLKGADFRQRLGSRTADGIEIEPLYTGDTRAHAVVGAEDAPFTLGTHLKDGGWRIAQLRTEVEPSALAAAICEDVAGGADAVTIRTAAARQSGIAPE